MRRPAGTEVGRIEEVLARSIRRLGCRVGVGMLTVPVCAWPWISRIGGLVGWGWIGVRRST